jgi:Leucine-rich repeat (LRR) protein
MAEGAKRTITTPAASTSDRLALIALYESTDGPAWTDRTNWRNADDTDFNDVGTECTWYGVTCDSSSRIITIDLESNNLSGPLPPELGNLAFLSTLRLGWNQLTGSIPPELSNLSNLSTFSAYSNLLSGSLPPELGLMANLNSLDLGFNNLTGALPPKIGHMSSLWTLQINSNYFTGEIPVEIANLTGLWTLDLSFNSLSGPIPPEIGNMSGLRNLYLDHNQLNGSLPAELAMLTSLQNLDLDHNNLGGPIPGEIWTLDQLKTLDLSSNNFVGSLPIQLRHFSDLYLLYLSWNDFEGPIPPEFGEISKLKYLSLEMNRLSGSIPPELGQLGVLEILRLDRNRLTGSIPPELGNLAALKSLSLYSNHLTGHLPRELGDLTALNYINIRSNAISGFIPIEVTQLENLWNSSGLRFSWNALDAENAETTTFVDAKHGQFDGYWRDTQTLPPAGVTVDSVHNQTVWLSWNPVNYPAVPGGSEVFCAPTGTDSWMSVGWTWDKLVTAFPATGLDADTSYECAVGSFTYPHSDNENLVDSELGPSEVVVTATTGCDAPVVEKGPGATPMLTVVPSTGTVDWSTGETTPSIVVAPASARWYWVRVTDGGCDEAATVYVDPALVFRDGFETGDVSAWSSIRPGD